MTDQRRAKTNGANKRSATTASLGTGGELHQQGSVALTTNHGVPLSDHQNSLRLGDRGPTLLEDFALREKIFHFDHERIPERIVHARGSPAHGYFECTAPIAGLTMATLFQKKGNRGVQAESISGWYGIASPHGNVLSSACATFTIRYSAESPKSCIAVRAAWTESSLSSTAINAGSAAHGETSLILAGCDARTNTKVCGERRLRVHEGRTTMEGDGP